MPTGNIVQVLQVGVIGLGFLLALMAYRLLSQEMMRDESRPSIMRAIYVFMCFSIVLCGIGVASQFLPSNTTNESPSTKPVNSEPNSLDKATLHLSAGSMTVIPHLNLGVKLSAGENFNEKSREVRLLFSYPKNPLAKITEQNKVDESIVSIQGQWIRPDSKHAIFLGELGEFEVSVTKH